MDGGRTRRHWGAILLIGVLSTAGLVACTDNGPSVQPSTTATSTAPVESSTPSSTATLPTAPKAQPTPKSAETFVKYFWDVYNYSYATLNPEPLKSISEDGCKFCASTIDDVAQLSAAGDRIQGLTVHLLSVAAPPVKDATRIAVVSVLRQDDGRNLKSDGSVQKLVGRKATQSLAALHWVGGKWQVRGISIDVPKETP